VQSPTPSNTGGAFPLTIRTRGCLINLLALRSFLRQNAII
jgi:hypothetical protein